jgi:septum formation protein
MSNTKFILASTSTSRRSMLEAAGVAMSVIAPNVDEELLRARLTGGGADAKTIADALAEAKALTVSQTHPDALVLGADQILVCDGRMFSKALEEREARATLLTLCGREHELISAAVIAKGGTILWRHVETARLRMRQFSDEFLQRYLTAEIPEILGSVGCYRIESLGAQLFSEIDGDQFCIRGLPLIAVLAVLREYGAILP